MNSETANIVDSPSINAQMFPFPARTAPRVLSTENLPRAHPFLQAKGEAALPLVGLLHSANLRLQVSHVNSQVYPRS